MMFFVKGVRGPKFPTILNASQVIKLEVGEKLTSTLITMSNGDLHDVEGGLEHITNNMMWAMGSTRQYENLEAKYNKLMGADHE